MKYQFNWFGIIIIAILFAVFSSMGFLIYESPDEPATDDPGYSAPDYQSFDNNTDNNTQPGDNQTQPDDNQTEPDDDNKTCSTGWRPPVENKADFNAGSTIPVKFAYCSNNTFVIDENVTVTILDDSNNTVEQFFVAKNPHLGIAIQGQTQYHVNWKTPKDAPGNYTIIASFSDGFSLTKDITLF